MSNIQTIVAAQGLDAVIPPTGPGNTVTVVLPAGATNVAFAGSGGIASIGGTSGELVITLDGTPGSLTISWLPAGAQQGQGFNPQMTLQIPGSGYQKLNPVGPSGTVKILGPRIPSGTAAKTVGLSAAAKVAIGAGVVAAGVGGVAVAGAINEGNAGHYFGIAGEAAVGAAMEARRRAKKL